MSFDLYLLPLQPTDDFDTAMSVLDQAEGGDLDDPSIDVRGAAQTLLELDPRYQRFQKDRATIEQLEGIDEAITRRILESVELNGTDDTGNTLAQFIFNRSHVVIHCYDGTTNDELDHYVIALCRATGLAAVDPQTQDVWRLQDDGTLA